MIKSLNVAEQTKLSPFESELVESKQELIRFWFTQEIFDTLVFDTEKQIEKFETETKELKQFLSQLHKGKDSKKKLLIFKEHERIYDILSRILHVFWRDYSQLIDFLKQPYVWLNTLKKYIQENDVKWRKQGNIEKFSKYLKAYGKYEYTVMETWKKLIEFGMAEKWDMGKNRHMIKEKGEDEWAIVFTSKEKHIVISKLPKTPYYKKRIAWAWKDFIHQAPPTFDGPF